MDYVIFPMKTINITQRALNSYSHKNLEAWDIAGKDSGIESAYAPCTCKVLAKLPYETTGFSNTVFFGSCDENGKEAEVMTENGQKRVLTFALTHDNDISDIELGHIYKSGDKIYDEGKKGNATGNHIHIEVAEGWQTRKKKRSDGVWAVPNIVHIADVFFQLAGWNTIKKANGYLFKSVKERQIPEEYELRYDGNAEGVTNVPEWTSHRKGESVLVSSQVPLREGYVFDHWNSQSNDSGYTYHPGEVFDHDWFTVLWAQWREEEKFTLAEAMKVFRSIAGKVTLTEEEKKKYDLNGDGKISLVDVLKILREVAGKE